MCTARKCYYLLTDTRKTSLARWTWAQEWWIACWRERTNACKFPPSLFHPIHRLSELTVTSGLLTLDPSWGQSSMQRSWPMSCLCLAISENEELSATQGSHCQLGHSKGSLTYSPSYKIAILPFIFYLPSPKNDLNCLYPFLNNVTPHTETHS